MGETVRHDEKFSRAKLGHCIITIKSDSCKGKCIDREANEWLPTSGRRNGD